MITSDRGPETLARAPAAVGIAVLSSAAGNFSSSGGLPATAGFLAGAHLGAGTFFQKARFPR